MITTPEECPAGVPLEPMDGYVMPHERGQLRRQLADQEAAEAKAETDLRDQAEALAQRRILEAKMFEAQHGYAPHEVVEARQAAIDKAEAEGRQVPEHLRHPGGIPVARRSADDLESVLSRAAAADREFRQLVDRLGGASRERLPDVRSYARDREIARLEVS